MEGTVFRAPEVSGIMKQHFVEARLHVDTQNHLTPEQFALNQKYQSDLVDTLALPYYAVIDPVTFDPEDAELVGEHALSGGPGEWQSGWIEFLNFALSETGRR